MSARSRGRKRRAPGQTTLLGDRKPQAQPQPAEQARRLPSPGQMIDAALRRQTGAPAPVAETAERRTGPQRIPGTPPVPDVPRPAFNPKDANRQTGAMPALGDPYAAQPADIAPAIFKTLVASLPAGDPVPPLQLGPPVLVEGEPYNPARGPRIELYARPGWTAVPNRDREAEIDAMKVIVERGMGSNAAEEATALRHARQAIPRAARTLCSLFGESHLVHALLRRVEHFNATETPEEIRAALGLDGEAAA